MIPIGAHVPMSDGLEGALVYARSVGCEAIQIFTKSPRRWAGPPLDPSAADRFSGALAEAGIPLFTHASYLINMGAESDEQWQMSTFALADELVRGYQVGASGVVVHLGRRFSEDMNESLDRIARCAAEARDIAGGMCARILLENSAGAGKQFGVTVAEMSAALVVVRAAGVDAALCFDTCHGFAGGIDVRTSEGWAEALAEIESVCGPDAIALIHANDCKGDLGSHKDRHDWIGDGLLGSEAFRAMFAQPALANAAVVVEMPGEVPVKDEENVRRLKSLRDDAGASGAPDPGRA